MGRRDPRLPQFPDASPATCVQAFVDDAFGYYRPGGEVGSPLPLPVQVRVRALTCLWLDVAFRLGFCRCGFVATYVALRPVGEGVARRNVGGFVL